MFRALLSLALLQAPSDLEQRKEQFWEAARRGDAATVKALLAKGVDVNTRFRADTTALWWAAYKGHFDVVKVLLDHGADVNARETGFGSTPLDAASFLGNAKILEMLFEKGAQGPTVPWRGQ